MTHYERVTLALAILGIVLATLSLLWQFLTWHRSGPVIKVSVSLSPQYVLGDGGSMIPLDGTEEIVAISATNVGRMEAAMVTWGFHLEDGYGGSRDLYLPPPPAQVPVPPQHSQFVAIAKRQLFQLMATDGMVSARGFVRLATGDLVDAPASDTVLAV